MLSRGGAIFAQLTCLVLLCVSAKTTAQGSADSPFTLRPLASNVWAAISDPKSATSAGANTGFVIGDDGVAVIDTTVSFGSDGRFGTEPARRLLATIRTLTNLPVKFVINTHHHLDHVGANAVFADDGAIVLAHRNVRDWIHSENLRMLGVNITPRQKAFIEALRPPAITYVEPVNLYLGSREILVQTFPGHTGGDSVVVIPDANVVFAGDLFWHDMLPNLMDASTEPWIDTLDRLATSEASATFVPGHGDVGNAPDVVAFRGYLATLRKLVSDAQALRQSGEVLADAVTPALRGRYGRWEDFAPLARLNILAVEAELNGTKRLPQAQPVK